MNSKSISTVSKQRYLNRIWEDNTKLTDVYINSIYVDGMKRTTNIFVPPTPFNIHKMFVPTVEYPDYEE